MNQSDREASEQTMSSEGIRDLLVRPEVPSDYHAIDEIQRTAFSPDSRPAELVQAVRNSEAYIPELSLTAQDGSEVVGHVMVSRGWLVNSSGAIDVLYLSPLAVRPDKQGAGIGRALVEQALTLAAGRDEPAVILEGSPLHYARYGFETAKDYGIEMHLPSWAPVQAGQVFRLPRFNDAVHGRLELPPVFDIVKED